jgi:hypothetical protein
MNKYFIGAARLAATNYAGNEPANSLTRYHREAVANLLKGKPILASFSERMENAQLSTSFVHEEPWRAAGSCIIR